MVVIVTDTGFDPDHMPETGGMISISPDTDLSEVTGAMPVPPTIRIEFASFADGRGFSIARRLRHMGYGGRLRARGLVADQYAMARRSGFDEVEIDDDLAARQPQDQWLARAGWRAHDYQARLRGPVESVG